MQTMCWMREKRMADHSPLVPGLSTTFSHILQNYRKPQEVSARVSIALDISTCSSHSSKRKTTAPLAETIRELIGGRSTWDAHRPATFGPPRVSTYDLLTQITLLLWQAKCEIRLRRREVEIKDILAWRVKSEKKMWRCGCVG